MDTHLQSQPIFMCEIVNAGKRRALERYARA